MNHPQHAQLHAAFKQAGATDEQLKTMSLDWGKWISVIIQIISILQPLLSTPAHPTTGTP